MNKRILTFGFFFLAVAVAVSGAWAGQPSGSPIVDSTDATKVPAKKAAKAKAVAKEPAIPLIDRPTEEIVGLLSLEDKISQLMLVAVQGVLGPNRDDQALLKAFVPGGVVLPGVGQPESSAEYVVSLRGLPAESRVGIPMLIGADPYRTSGSSVSVASTTPLPTMLSLTATGNLKATENTARYWAQQLKAVGCTFSFGPSLELAPTLPDAVGSLQCAGSDPDWAAQLAGTLTKTLLDEDILAMPIGFPGGGLDRTDKGPATLLTPRARVREHDLLPYTTAIAAGADLILVSNTLAPTLQDKAEPSSLSPDIMRNLLRTELGYDGIIVAGPLDSHDVASLYPAGEAAIRALNAGADMLYWSTGGEHVNRARVALVDAVHKGIVREETVNAALARVLELKKKHHLKARELPDPQKAAGAANKGHLAKELPAIDRQSITLVQNRDNTLPLQKDSSTPIAITGVMGVEGLRDILEKKFKPVFAQEILTAKHLGEIEDFEIKRLISSSARTTICIFPDSKKTAGQVKLVGELKAHGTRVVVILFGYPRNVPLFQEADAILVAYCDPTRSGSMIPAMADILAGEAPLQIVTATGDLPVHVGVPETFDIQKVLRSPAGRLPVSVGEPYVAGQSVGYATPKSVKRVEWNFGDGTQAKEPRTQHTYISPGRYPLSVSATGGDDQDLVGHFWVSAQ